MDENKSSKGVGISIAMILLAIVIGFGVVIGLTQTDSAKNLNNVQTEISNYTFDENGTLLSYSGDMTEIEIPSTFSLSDTTEEVNMTSTSLTSLVDRARNLGIREFKIKDESGSYEDDWGNTYYQNKYILSYSKRRSIPGNDYQVTAIGASAFTNNLNIKSVVIPESVTSINSRAFYGCTNLKTITLPEDLRRIENAAFYNCAKLENVTLPNTIEYIGSQAFQNCDSLTEVTLPNSMYEISDSCFYNCDRLTTVNISSSIRYIYGQAFYNCRQLSQVNIAEGLQYIEYGAFYNCRMLNNITLPSTFRYLASDSFYNCISLNTVIINSSTVPQMNGLAFSSQYLNKIYVQDALYDSYLTTGNWPNYASYITKISEMI